VRKGNIVAITLPAISVLSSPLTHPVFTPINSAPFLIFLSANWFNISPPFCPVISSAKAGRRNIISFARANPVTHAVFNTFSADFSMKLLLLYASSSMSFSINC